MQLSNLKILMSPNVKPYLKKFQQKLEKKKKRL